jgi:hypothetical protein
MTGMSITCEAKLVGTPDLVRVEEPATAFLQGSLARWNWIFTVSHAILMHEHFGLEEEKMNIATQRMKIYFEA